MPGNSFGELFRLHTFGESHGPAIGGVVDGCPPALSLDLEAIQHELDKRRPGQSEITTQRKEEDKVEFLSGIFENKTLGTPIAFLVRNKDTRAEDYDHLRDVYRPSHADFVFEAKYGFRDHRGGGRASARETVARVVAGAIARQLLARLGVKVWAYVSQVGNVQSDKTYKEMDAAMVESNVVRCPDQALAKKMLEHIEAVRQEGDSVGGVITCVAQGVPAGWGEPVFDKLHADLGKAMLNINAVKGFEIGSGFRASGMRGSGHNDVFEGLGKTATNHSGGIQGGISNGEDIYFNVAFKPVATIMKTQESVNRQGEKVTLSGKGRHDPCVVPRAVPIVEAMALLVLADHYLRQKAVR